MDKRHSESIKIMSTRGRMTSRFTKISIKGMIIINHTLFWPVGRWQSFQISNNIVLYLKLKKCFANGTYYRSTSCRTLKPVRRRIILYRVVRPHSDLDRTTYPRASSGLSIGTSLFTVSFKLFWTIVVFFGHTSSKVLSATIRKHTVLVS